MFGLSPGISLHGCLTRTLGFASSTQAYLYTLPSQRMHSSLFCFQLLSHFYIWSSEMQFLFINKYKVSLCVDVGKTQYCTVLYIDNISLSRPEFYKKNMLSFIPCIKKVCVRLPCAPLPFLYHLHL